MTEAGRISFNHAVLSILSILAILCVARLSPAGAQENEEAPQDKIPQSASIYIAGTTTWEEFVADGWFERLPSRTHPGLLRVEGSLSGKMIVLTGEIRVEIRSLREIMINQNRSTLQLLNSGIGVNYRPQFFAHEGDIKNRVVPDCILEFEGRKLIDLECAE